MNKTEPLILGIESSCDETSAAVIRGNKILANVISSQRIHDSFGGVVPELASRAHQQQIVHVVNQALNEAKVQKKDLHAVAYTNGPGLMGSLLVGSSFAKSFAYSLGIPTIEVNHMHAHIMAHFGTRDGIDTRFPEFPFLCLTVSGGHTQILLVESYLKVTVLGETQDDAVGEAFDKIAKYIGLPYPGGPLVDKLAKDGDPQAFRFPKPKVPGYGFSFSGLKTSVLYFIQKQLALEPDFLELKKSDLCASVQKTIVDILMDKLKLASNNTNVNRVALAGGVAANSSLRTAVSSERGWTTFIPPMELCTDNAAMVALAGYYKWQNSKLGRLDSSPFARFNEM